MSVVTPGSAGYVRWGAASLRPCMWPTHIRDLSPSAEAVREATCQGNKVTLVDSGRQKVVSQVSALVSVSDKINIIQIIDRSLRSLAFANRVRWRTNFTFVLEQVDLFCTVLIRVSKSCNDQIP